MKNILILFTLLVCSCENASLQIISEAKNTDDVKKITVVPLDGVDIKDVELCVKELKTFYKCDVELLDYDNLPDSLSVNNSYKYNSHKILLFLKEKYKKYNGKILGLTNKEISVKERNLNGVIYKNWSVLGLGSLNGKSCIVSTKLIKTNKKDRLAKVVIHEIGHTLSISHCKTSSHCLMNDAKGTAKTIDKEKKIMCDSCRKKIKW
jgi:predicted Zn-dependent protease